MNKVKRCLAVFSLLILMFFSAINLATAAPNESIPEVDIATTPTKVLFDVDNMKPGDWADRTIKISNKGKQDFTYTMSTHLKSGSKKLYNELTMKVSDAKGELYNGKISDFKGFDGRNLAKTAEEDLNFTVEFPAHLGNEFQGLETEVEFKFYVAGTLGGLLPVDGPKLPETGTNTFVFLTLGAIMSVASLLLMAVQRYRRKRLEPTRP
ncbi:LPXTG cell wall anchor domain-containing protein [Bacillus salacetis]|uniref:LPXTG cell wall anchor domain-containing protein n=1 Tax=Bacillus salacetis TaxID=2315464 RepID=A0A3A1R2Z3_9BACI|nr:LPXTG cell wall anchor domain-containing protein [Bacillus salacetis]RIW36096.1 LPXTG cell wall anchor domain-containing protein [Bacillus salacetis]